MLEKINQRRLVVFIILILCLFSIIQLLLYINNWNTMYNNALEIQKLHPEHNLNLVYFKLDTYNVFMDLMINSRLNIIQLILPIILIIPAIFDLHYLLKSGVFKDLMIRSSYKKVITLYSTFFCNSDFGALFPQDASAARHIQVNVIFLIIYLNNE